MADQSTPKFRWPTASADGASLVAASGPLIRAGIADGLDGEPRVTPIGFWTEGERVVMATVPKSAKVAALRDEQYPGWVAGVQGLYDEMAVINITPTWAKLLGVETTTPKAVEDLIKEKVVPSD